MNFFEPTRVTENNYYFFCNNICNILLTGYIFVNET